ncbi:MAG: hypothetical protein LUH15_10975 [Tannerellaceae bacterium]|nr:hypothetical protein [Tannerellaceae bacterium]
MKAIKLVFVAALTAVVLMLTSCMGDGSNSYSGHGYGIVKYDATTGRTLLFGAYYYPLYSAELQLYPENEYLAVYYSLDLDDETNANYTDKGYVVANISIQGSESEGIKRGSVDYYSTIDIKTPQKDEVKTAGFEILNLVDYRLISGIGISNYNKEDQLSYTMECDIDQEPENNGSSGLKVYDLYLRTIQITTSSSSGSANAELVVFPLSSPINNFKAKESSAGRSSFYIRFNYATSVSEDNITWTQSPLIELSSSNS